MLKFLPSVFPPQSFKRLQIISLIYAQALVLTSVSSAVVTVGVEKLVESRYDCLRGKSSVGIIANPTSVLPATMEHIVDVMARDKELVNISAVFGPEHGFRGAHEDGQGQKTYIDPRTNLTVYDTFGVSGQRLVNLVNNSGVDAIVFDIQDVGSRFYTYVWTMVDMMVAAASLSSTNSPFTFVVLDRPNPIGGIAVRGPVMQTGFTSFVGRMPGVPIVHGMTVGELARFANSEYVPLQTHGKHVELTVIKMSGWLRSMLFAETGLPWILPSPNMPTPSTALVYPGMCLLEASTLSEGRGTTRPFQVVGAPYLDWRFAEALQAAAKTMLGVLIREVYFTPTFSKFEGNLSAGVDIIVRNATALNPLRVGLTVLTMAKRMAPSQFGWRAPGVHGGRYDVDLLTGGNMTRLAVDRGMSVDDILSAYEQDLAGSGFEERRRKCLLY